MIEVTQIQDDTYGTLVLVFDLEPKEKPHYVRKLDVSMFQYIEPKACVYMGSFETVTGADFYDTIEAHVHEAATMVLKHRAKENQDAPSSSS